MHIALLNIAGSITCGVYWIKSERRAYMDEQDKRIISQFTAQSKKFSSGDYALSSRELLDWAVQRMKLDKEDRVLDVAAGTGLLSIAVSKHVKSVTALDITEAMLEEGRLAASGKGITNVTFKNGNANDLSIERDYDIVMSRLAFHHFSRPGDVLSQMANAVRPGGGVTVIDIVSPDDDAVAKRYNRYECLRDDSHVRALTADELAAVFRENGLRDINVYRRDVINDVESWMNMTNTPPPVRESIWKAIKEELSGGEETGFSPFTDGSGNVKFFHRWAMLTARKL